MKKMLLALMVCTSAFMNAGNFDGFYVGANLGVLSQEARLNDLDGFLTDNSGWSCLNTGFVGGGQVGYDWQCGCKVFGVVADFNGTTIDHSLRDNPNVSENDNYIKSDFSWYSTIRGRAGVEVCCDALFYITAGAAVARHKDTWNDDDLRSSNSDTRWGWTAGVGAEYAFCNNFNLGGDLFFMHFADNNHSSTLDSERYSFKRSSSVWGARLTVNYRLCDLACF